MSKLLDIIHQKQKKIAESRNRLTTLKPKNGTNRYRLLPSWRGEGEEFWHDYGAHWVKDAAGSIKGVFTCQYATYGKKCPVCDAIQMYEKTTDESTSAIIKQARAGRRALLNVLEVEGDKPNEPQILEVPYSVFEDILNLFVTWKEKLIQLDGGHDFTITRSGSGFNTSYTVAPCPDATNVNPKVLEKLNDLDKAVQTNTDPTNSLAGLSEVAGVLPPPSKPALKSVPQEQPMLVNEANVTDVDFEDAKPVTEVEIMDAAPEPEPTVSVENVSSDMSEAELAKFLGDL